MNNKLYTTHINSMKMQENDKEKERRRVLLKQNPLNTYLHNNDKNYLTVSLKQYN